MALIKCEDCENEYSDKAKECPKCGCPTTNNTISEKRKNIEECSVKINGDETLVPKLKGISIILIIVPLFIFWFTAMTLPTKELKEMTGLSELGGFIIFIVIPWIGIFGSPYFSTLFDEYKKRKKESSIINNYFKKRFILLSSLPENYSDSMVINKTNSTNEILMFDIYMEAYKFNADAIVVNDSNVTTHVSGSNSKTLGGHTSSSNKFHITATLVRY